MDGGKMLWRNPLVRDDLQSVAGSISRDIAWMWTAGRPFITAPSGAWKSCADSLQRNFISLSSAWKADSGIAGESDYNRGTKGWKAGYLFSRACGRPFLFYRNTYLS